MTNPMPRLLSEFFDNEYRDLHDLAPDQAKRYRDAIGRASQALGHAAEFIDAIEPGFRDRFIEDLLRLGFSMQRCREYADCVADVTAAMREAKRLAPRPKRDRATTATPPRFSDFILDPADQVCVGDFDALQKLHEQVIAAQESDDT